MTKFKWIADDVIQGRKFTEDGEAGPAMIGRQSNSENWFIVWCDARVPDLLHRIMRPARVSLPYTRQKIADMLNRGECTPVED